MLKCCFCGLTRIFFYWSLNYLPLQTSPAPNETWEKAENNILTKTVKSPLALAFHWDNFQLSLSNNSCSWNECILLPWGSSKPTLAGSVTATRIWKQEFPTHVETGLLTVNFELWTALRVFTVMGTFRTCWQNLDSVWAIFLGFLFFGREILDFELISGPFLDQVQTSGSCWS